MRVILKPFYTVLFGFVSFFGGYEGMAVKAAVPQEISFLYGSVGSNGLFWSGTNQVLRNRKLIPEILSGATRHGLNPDQFMRDELEALVKVDTLSIADQQALDQALTYALWQYASELAGGQMADLIFLDIILSNDMARAVEDLAPKTELYNRLQSRLIEIETAKSPQDSFPTITFNGLLRQGDEHANVPLLRARFMQADNAGDIQNNPYVYDDALADAIKSFQAEHGLRADGIVGPSTLKYLNRNPRDERRQIIANMARLRDPEWRNRPDLRIDVDIARYWLKAYEAGSLAFEMPVVVGTPNRKTVRFSTVMTGVRLNPGWTLPPTIKTEDYIPKLRSNPEWVSEQGVMIYTSWDANARPVDPTTVDWSMFSDSDIKAMRMYKAAGAENPLGEYRFLMNNQYDIYLHDTPSKSLFGRAMRAKSSGCVRVQDPRRVAEFLLKDDPSWTSDKIDSVLASGKTVNVGAKRRIPVYFDYKTVWVDENDQLVLGVDVYDFDNQAYNDIISYQGRTGRELKALLQNMTAIQMTNIGNESRTSNSGFFNSLF